jgi:ABC-type transport system involved in cytochrome bd biosynthesis fused ATPase/permease subunit
MNLKSEKPSQGDIIMLKELPNNVVRSALMLNKRYKFCSNYSSTIISHESTVLSSLSFKQAILLETPFANLNDISHLFDLLKTPLERDIVEKSLEYLGDLERSCKRINHREYLYLNLVSLFLQQRDLLIIDKINFEKSVELEQLYIRSILNFKKEKTTIIAQQQNGLDLICNKIVSMKENRLITENSDCDISNIEMLSSKRDMQNSEKPYQKCTEKLKKVV